MQRDFGVIDARFPEHELYLRGNAAAVCSDVSMRKCF